jgi:hypothetical protein
MDNNKNFNLPYFIFEAWIQQFSAQNHIDFYAAENITPSP